MRDLPNADVVIITALALERDAVLRRLGNAERVTTKSRVYYRAGVGGSSSPQFSVVLLALSGMGTAAAAVATTQAIDVWNPQHIFLTGITGGVKKPGAVSLGDLIVAEQIVGYETGKLTEGGMSRRYEAYRPSHALLQRARDFASRPWQQRIDVPRPDGDRDRAPHVHFGVVASGDKVITAPDFVSDLREVWPRLLGVEMEGVGTATAAYQADTAPGILFVKGISDWADSSKNDNWQLYAADVAAAFTCSLLESVPFSPEENRSQPARVQPFQFTGKHKIRLCERLGDDWYDLADYFEIPDHVRRRFPRGRECQAIWEWLAQRAKLEGLPTALDFIGRTDLGELLKQAV